MNLALVIFNKQRIFKDDIRAWKRTNLAYKTWDNFKHDFREAYLELRETGVTIDELGFHNANANANTIVDQMMAQLQIDEDEHTATSTQYATELASTNQANATMEYQMQTILSQVQYLQLANTHGNQTNHGSNFGCGCGRGHGCGASRGTERGRECG